jgi:hypothetical protein
MENSSLCRDVRVTVVHVPSTAAHTARETANHFKKIEINLSSYPIEYQGIPVIVLID